MTALRVITWNVARRSSRLAEQGAALASRDPDVIALQEVTETTLPLWRAVLERIGLPHVRASLDTADPSRVPASRRRTGVLLASAVPLGTRPRRFPVPWTETVVAAVAATAIGPVEIHCLHVPNAANGWIKPQTLQAVRAGLEAAPPMARVVCGDLNTPRRELETGEVMSFARDSRGRPSTRARDRLGRGGAGRRPRPEGASATRTPTARFTATRRASRAGPGSESQGTAAGGASITSLPRRS